MLANKPLKKILAVFLIVVLMMLNSCSQVGNLSSEKILSAEVNRSGEKTVTPFLPAEKTTAPTLDVSIFVPEIYQQYFNNVGGVYPVSKNTESICRFDQIKDGDPWVEVVFALVVPFDTVLDSVSSAALMDFFGGKSDLNGEYDQIAVHTNHAEILSQYFDFSIEPIVFSDERDMRAYLYNNRNTIGLISFETLHPSYKVLSLDGVSPYDQNFNLVEYGLTIRLGINCSNGVDESFTNPYWTNRDPQKMTSVLMTGTTALTRAIAHRMEIYGNQYPGEKIKIWFDDADISHLSNEVAYYEGCPPADPNQSDLFFCGRPEYLELFSFVGVDVVELTGNHLTDKGVPPLVNTMELLDQMTIPYYAAGRDLDAAQEAVYFEHNGNRIAFIGCNAAGPTFVYGSETRAGVNPCDMEQMAASVRQVVEEGYLPIVTFQYWETYQFKPMPWQREDSRTMINNGAVIVSGSQAHLPMTMAAYKDGFIHYGLGNLFFDQMDVPVTGTRREFADRHIFYDGQYLGVHLYTAMLEDYAQPRPMTLTERQSLLTDAFVDFSYLEE